jgi:hypothetical protein
VRRLRRGSSAGRAGTLPRLRCCHGTDPIRNVLRIDNVETERAERITANDEERRHQGFDIQTVFALPKRDGTLDIVSAIASDSDGPILSIDYASGATISRLNKGLRRRKKKTFLALASIPRPGAGAAVPRKAKTTPRRKAP